LGKRISLALRTGSRTRNNADQDHDHATVEVRDEHGPHAAEDLTQDFFMVLFERERLRGLGREGGRFRSFLLKALQNFLANEWDRASAKKRGGGSVIASLEEVDAESRYLADPSSEAPEVNFERHWAFTVIEHAMRNLEAELKVAG
jgi:DNA-directed RNA polymerase specialized sigma24 family protein